MKLDYKCYGKPIAPCVLTIGNFDGVHRGHQHLIKYVIKEAKTQNLESSVLCFNPRPATYLAHKKNISPPIDILTHEDKISMLLDLGVDRVISLNFNSIIRDMLPKEFFQKVIVEACYTQSLILGSDFHFGKNRKGNVSLLESYCQNSSVSLSVVRLLADGHKKVSSSYIRNHIESGNLSECNNALGYCYFIRGEVVHGDGRGSSIGFSTANIKPDNHIYLSGVFATKITLEDASTHLGVTNIGYKPTFNGKIKTCEMHIFDFNKVIYGEKVKLVFCKKIRDEKAFDSIDDLVKQIQLDSISAQEYFKENNS